MSMAMMISTSGFVMERTRPRTDLVETLPTVLSCRVAILAPLESILDMISTD